MNRRFLLGMGALFVSAPAIVRASSLMPVSTAGLLVPPVSIVKLLPGEWAGYSVHDDVILKLVMPGDYIDFHFDKEGRPQATIWRKNTEEVVVDIAPLHGPGNDPYIIFERSMNEEIRTMYTGEVRK